MIARVTRGSRGASGCVGGAFRWSSPGHEMAVISMAGVDQGVKREIHTEVYIYTLCVCLFSIYREPPKSSTLSTPRLAGGAERGKTQADAGTTGRAADAIAWRHTRDDGGSGQATEPDRAVAEVVQNDEVEAPAVVGPQARPLHLRGMRGDREQHLSAGVRPRHRPQGRRGGVLGWPVSDPLHPLSRREGADAGRDVVRAIVAVGATNSRLGRVKSPKALRLSSHVPKPKRFFSARSNEFRWRLLIVAISTTRGACLWEKSSKNSGLADDALGMAPKAPIWTVPMAFFPVAIGGRAE